MDLLKRHIGRRVAGVGAVVALVVLGLEAPAFAVTPTVSGFTPGSGPQDCVVDITGTNFLNPAVTSVTFGTRSAVFQIISDSEIWAMSPGGSGSGGYVTVTNADGDGVSTQVWVNTNPGDCTPTADSFSPACGPAGTEVTVIGTNLLRSVNPAVGAHVYFGATTSAGTGPNAMEADETSPATPPGLTQRVVRVPAGATSNQDGPISVWTFDDTVGGGGAFAALPFTVGTCITSFSPQVGPEGTVVTITGIGFDHVTEVDFFDGVSAAFLLTSNTGTTDTITATVPAGAATGPITLMTTDAPDGVSVSTSNFTVGTAVVKHNRKVTLRLRKHLIAKGNVTAPDGTAACWAKVPVKIQKRVSGHWKNVGKTTTNLKGHYKKSIKDKVGKYRAMAPKVILGSGDVCKKAVSPKVRHSH